jgi:serine/threonine-protein kinase
MTSHEESDLSVAALVGRLGRVFATFDASTQDSGHVSYGVLAADGRRHFVKTAGDRSVSPGGATHRERVEALRRAASIQHEVDHPALVPLQRVIEAADGVVVVHDWFDGELLRSPTERRNDPREAFSRFRSLPVPEIVTALDAVIDLHATLEHTGWLAGDFYDGCLMYDFADRRITVMDLEAYHRGSFVNEVGRLPGSSRFMAPEEHTKGATIDARTTVFNLGRMLEIFLTSTHQHRALVELSAAATAVLPEERPPSVAALQRAWRSAIT